MTTATQPAAPAAMRIRVRLQQGVAEVQLLAPHPMETGMRQDPAGQLVPAHHITHLRASVGERVVFSAQMSIAVARDPLLAFRFRGAQAGERLRVAWADNRGQVRVDEAVIG
jgi:sulfur-oxidizing protein SoxZ